LKSKTWRRFWPDRFSKSSLILFILSSLLLTGINASEPLPLGLIQTIEQLVEIQTNQFNTLRNQINSNPVLLSQVDTKQQNLSLEPRFARSILFSSERKYLDLMRGDRCSFYALIENRLLRSPVGELTHLVVDYEDENGVKQHALVTRENFLQAVYENQCFQNRDLATLFGNPNINSTFASVNFNVPKKSDECKPILDEWNKNPNTPYFCRVAEVLNSGLQARLSIDSLGQNQIQQRREKQQLIDQYEFLRQNLSHFQRTYVQNMCNHLDNSDKFCKVYLAKDVWNQILNGEVPPWKMSYRCQEVLGKSESSVDDLRGCAQQFIENPDICRTQGALNYPSAYPYPRCDSISEALELSKLQTDYHDCPGLIDNEGIINISRLLNHFDPPKIKSNPQNCASHSLSRFANLNIDFSNQAAWPLQICHEDRIIGGDRCVPYVPGSNVEGDLSEERIIAQILHRQFNMQKSTQCRLVDFKSYNPNLLEFKTGCIILFNRDECTQLHCPKKIFVEQKEIEGITYKGRPTFDYFPNSFRNEKFAVTNILSETQRLSSRTIRNLTELTVFLNLEGNGVVHGIGCAEDLYPERFRRNGLNECRPLPFIIDGISTKDTITNLVVRFSIDDIHSPRLLNWNHIFTAITHYQNLHPLDSWMMHGLRR
jgi:hypothetical protein